MTIFVDGITPYPAEMTKGLPGKNWCHMVSDTSEEELHEFAARIGMKRSWFQGRPKASAAHYDLVPSRRALAVKLGAVEVTSRELVARNYDGLARRRRICVDAVPGADPDQVDRDVRHALEAIDREVSKP